MYTDRHNQGQLRINLFIIMDGVEEILPLDQRLEPDDGQVELDPAEERVDLDPDDRQVGAELTRWGLGFEKCRSHLKLGQASLLTLGHTS